MVVNKDIPSTTSPTPISNPENITNDKFSIMLGREMTSLVGVSRREAFKILSIRSVPPRKSRVQNLSLARKYHLEKWSE